MFDVEILSGDTIVGELRTDLIPRIGETIALRKFDRTVTTCEKYVVDDVLYDYVFSWDINKYESCVVAILVTQIK